MASKKHEKAIEDLDEYIDFMKSKAVQPPHIHISKLQHEALNKLYDARDGGVSEYKGYKVKVYTGD